MYVDTRTRVKLGDIVSEEVPVDMGVKQGCVLSPLLFALYISEIAVSLEDSGEGVMLQNERVKIIIPGLFFADDMALMANSVNGMCKLLSILGEGCEERALEFNGPKSKILVNWRKPDPLNRWYISNTLLAEGDMVEFERDITLECDMDPIQCTVEIGSLGDKMEAPHILGVEHNDRLEEFLEYSKTNIAEDELYKYLGVMLSFQRGTILSQSSNQKEKSPSNVW